MIPCITLKELLDLYSGKPRGNPVPVNISTLGKMEKQ